LSITSFPPILPLFAVVDVVDEFVDEPPDELPPQAATATQTVTTKISDVKRFIDILRFPF
jgi:hypothetical protein